LKRQVSDERGKTKKADSWPGQRVRNENRLKMAEGSPQFPRLKTPA